MDAIVRPEPDQPVLEAIRAALAEPAEPLSAWAEAALREGVDAPDSDDPPA